MGMISQTTGRLVTAVVALSAIALICQACSRPNDKRGTEDASQIEQDWERDNSASVQFWIASNRAHVKLGTDRFSEETPREITLYLEDRYFSEAQLKEVFGVNKVSDAQQPAYFHV